MPLAVGLLSGFSELLQILLLIVAVFLGAAFVITMIMHYRRKKEQLEPGEVQQIMAASPEGTGFKLEDEYVLFDHSGLIREYKTKLVNNHARYTALKQDFDKLEDKYNSLLLGKSSILTQHKTNNMEQPNPTMQETNAAVQALETERNELRDKLEKINQSCQNLEKEKADLLDKLSVLATGNEERLVTYDRWAQENRQLKNKLLEQDYTRDLVDEKKTQIDFLQQQLEQRIRNYHQSEQQLNEARQQLLAIRLDIDTSRSAIHTIKSELELKQEETSRLQLILTENEQALLSKTDRITYLENILQEIKSQNEMLNAAVADNQEKTSNLQQLLEDEQFKATAAEQKLASNKQLLHRLHKEFAACIEEETGESPIIALRPAYIHKSAETGWDETAVQ